MRKGEVRLNDARTLRGATDAEQPSVAPVRPLDWDADDTRRRARQLGLLLMAASSVVMIILLAAIWLTLRRLL